MPDSCANSSLCHAQPVLYAIHPHCDLTSGKANPCIKFFLERTHTFSNPHPSTIRQLLLLYLPCQCISECMGPFRSPSGIKIRYHGSGCTHGLSRPQRTNACRSDKAIENLILKPPHRRISPDSGVSDVPWAVHEDHTLRSNMACLVSHGICGVCIENSL